VKYLLDTNALIGLLKRHPGLVKRARQNAPQDFAVSSIVAHELFFGAYKSQRQAENLARVDNIQFEVLDFDKEDARQAGEVRAVLAKVGTPIGPYDVLIAGQAKARDLTLITQNTAEFSRVEGLRIEDWQSN
jgi:tRNA(fMet)-specific endonuclease VapC